MKKSFIFIILALISMALFAQTQVSGNQSGTWTADNSPYQVIGNVTVTSANTLTIEAGVTIDFQGYYQLKVQGNLQAIGTETDNILFTTTNQAVGWGGIRLESANGISNLSYCRIEYGKTSGEYPNIHGGGLALLSSNAIISNCIFADNDATGAENGMGGAVYAINTGTSSGTLTRFINCKFIRNHAYGEGGAIKLTSDMYTELIGCEFIENDCFYGGGAISFYAAFETKMTNCLFSNNFTEYSNGGALHTLGMGNSLILENCTITGNSANHGDGGAISLAYAEADIVNSIIYDNSGMYTDGIYIDFSSSAEINYSDLTMPADASGSHNINQDPLFVDDFDFHLTDSSPCIDAGTNIGLDFYGLLPDMGCFEWYPAETDNNQIIENHTSLGNYPNPFNPETTIKFNIKDRETGILSIYNLKGQIIESRQFNSGNHTYTWNAGKYASGVYFYRLTTDSYSEVKKMILMK